MLHGSCLCGRVAYEIDGALSDALNCHCSMCRKAQGGAFRSRASVPTAAFKWTRGESDITWYSSSPGTYRGFCSACGTPLLSRFDAHPEAYGLPLGALDDDPGVRPACHVHVASKAPWYEITDDLPQHPGPLP
ncbi:GFA family protein [Bordetella genomosp. 1]|uniref:Aldehyde-activating protein n=1 Tax=Bordetella genomosp. 1 TaxID=1395607 RepID=A0ABX4F824_9BORD|nr:GFA family protein [Bordetella genomosp. 1]OZI69256.1 aldehyde-activating protein [Bordetella genomosp. 1]